MLKFLKSLFQKNESYISSILSHNYTKAELLGMEKLVPPTETKILEDANRIINYSRTEDYRVWSKEAWTKVMASIDALQDPKASQDEVNFYRGTLKATLDLLRVSDQARLVRDSLQQEQVAKGSLHPSK